MPRVKCIKCGRIGNLTIKKTKSHGTTYEYYYVQHYIKETNKIEWCYLGRYDNLAEEYKEKLQDIHKKPDYTQTYTQMTSKQENPKSSISNEIKTESKRGCRLAWFRLGDLGSLDPGSNPGSPTIRDH